MQILATKKPRDRSSQTEVVAPDDPMFKALAKLNLEKLLQALPLAKKSSAKSKEK